MNNTWKAILGIGAAGLALKVWSDSKAMADKLKNPTNQTPSGTNSVGGVSLPTPVPKDSQSGLYAPTGWNVISPQAQSLAESNPSTAYGRGYWDVAGRA